jgi:osmoprotectant transport system ATP-binding protein
VITFEAVTKRYPDGTVAVDALDLEVPAGKTVVLVGPSGCGKTTTLRMINRLVEPTEGRILLDGQDVKTANPARLRRGIGYVIQQTGLFPHRTVEDNIATVPLLNGWRRSRARARAHELLDLVGLDQALARRYPYQLSGGQQQRVGVARALAADPPVLLMDEPFSAVDPLVRASLQDQLIALQTELHKTIVLVTHDIEEAIKVGDLVALYRQEGRLAQVGTPEQLLGAPADSYVANFVGFDRGIRRLSFFSDAGLEMSAEPVLSADVSVLRARASGEPWILVVNDGKPRGWVPADRLERFPGGTPLGQVPAEGIGHTFRVGANSLRAALDAAVLSPAGLAVGVDDSGSVVGVATFDQLRTAIQAASTAADTQPAEQDTQPAVQGTQPAEQGRPAQPAEKVDTPEPAEPAEADKQTGSAGHEHEHASAPARQPGSPP